MKVKEDYSDLLFQAGTEGAAGTLYVHVLLLHLHA